MTRRRLSTILAAIMALLVLAAVWSFVHMRNTAKIDPTTHPAPRCAGLECWEDQDCGTKCSCRKAAPSDKVGHCVAKAH